MVLMWMNWKNKANLIINDDMRYLLVDKNYNPHAWDDMMKALADSEPAHVERASSDELISYLKRHINEMNKDDLQQLQKALYDEDSLFNKDDILARIEDGDES